MPRKNLSAKNAYQREYYAKNKERVRGHHKAYRTRQGDRYRQMTAERCRRYREKHRDEIRIRNRQRARSQAEQVKQRERQLRYKFGITTVDFERLAESQGHKCAICGESEQQAHKRSPDPQFHHTTSSLSVDHDHSSGRVRGLLCKSCNNGLGRFLDNPDRLRKAADYLETAKRVTQKDTA